MARQLVLFWLMATCLAAAGARGQDVNELPLFFGSGTDAVRDLGCTLVTTSPSTFSQSTASDNVKKINAWMAQKATSGKQSLLYIPWGYIAINDTLGWQTTAVIRGYNGGAAIRIVPNGCQIICGGGWANGRYSVTDSVNKRTAGFMWVGNTTTPMIRLSGNGNKIVANLYGYPYVFGSKVPSVPRCRSAIELIQIDKYFSNGHHDIAATITGCDKAIRLEENASGHCDHLLFERLTTRDCLTTFYSDCEQAVNHKFNFVEHYCPVGVKSDVFNYQKGGNMKADLVTLTGGYGCTLLRTRQAASNGGSYIIDGLSVDRALLTATQASHGYFRLVDHESGSGFTIRIRGHMDFSSANIAVENWQNGGGEATVALVAPNVPWRSLALDVSGLDKTTAAAYPR